MRVLAMVYELDAGPGVFAEAMRSRGVELDEWFVPGGPPPAEPRSYDAVMSFGGSMHAEQEADHAWLARQKALHGGLLDEGVPLLAVCLGAQLLGEAAGVPARRLAEPEIGWYEIEVNAEGEADPLIGPLAPRFDGFLWHSFEVPEPAAGLALARSAACLQAYRLGESAWGIQFHAEVAEADLDSWISTYGSDHDNARSGFSAGDLRREADRRLAGWNDLGRGLCGRFLDAVAALPIRV